MAKGPIEIGKDEERNRMKRVFGFLILLMLAGCSKSLLTEDARRAHYLMPRAGTKAHTEWVEKYGDTADSWELFSIQFLTTYVQRLTATVKELHADPNETVVITDRSDPNDPG